MKLTGNLNLKKPEGTDVVNIDDLNQNMDILDVEVTKLATPSQNGRMSAADKAKLDGIEAGAQRNTVTSVNSKTGAVTLTASDVGASPTGHTHTFAAITGKPTTLAGYGITDAISSSQRGSVNGVASLDESARVPTSQLPSASTGAAGVVQLNNTVTSTSTTQAATANAVKQAHDRAVSAENNARGYLDGQKGKPNGVATLDASGKVPASQLNISMTGSAISITDSGDYYNGSNVEAALQEIGQVLNAMRGNLIMSVNNILSM